MSNEIPEDLYEKALDAYCLARDDQPTLRDAANVIARAILAEREAQRTRDAKVAELHGDIVSNDIIGKACSRNIAADIRDKNGVLSRLAASQFP